MKHAFSKHLLNLFRRLLAYLCKFARKWRNREMSKHEEEEEDK